ncbi:hypothetical protein NDU88_008187 [Pleurodeles waltl]|uniref:Uncharacterized protein n=1 Tax=Pleurodeles waltl TaxID=8319 RepID=A0AAV7VRU9_PLEWA|nr:hypothetical protein NDU88_008187 [Pleurodeles waltl]
MCLQERRALEGFTMASRSHRLVYKLAELGATRPQYSVSIYAKPGAQRDKALPDGLHTIVDSTCEDIPESMNAGALVNFLGPGKEGSRHIPLLAQQPTSAHKQGRPSLSWPPALSLLWPSPLGHRDTEEQQDMLGGLRKQAPQRLALQAKPSPRVLQPCL